MGINIKTCEEELIGFIGNIFNCEDILKMKKGDYKIRFENNQLSASWIKEVTLVRNGLMNLYNSGKYNLVKEYFDNIDFYDWSIEDKEYLISFNKLFFG